MTYEEMEAGLAAFQKFGGSSGPSNVSEYLKLMDCPEDSLRVIHVAGTNGKGSVCAFIDSILREAGYRTGLFTSPHLIRINERFRINGQPAGDELLTASFEAVREIIRKGRENGQASPTWFEVIYLMGMWIFRQCDVDYCILETGMGGRLDATVTSHPLITVITSISMDHMGVLGDTLEEIASEKAGIFKEGVPAVVLYENQAVFQVLLDESKRKNVCMETVRCDDVTILKIEKNKIDFSINSSYYRYEALTIIAQAGYQVYNAALALAAVKKLLPDLEEGLIRRGLLAMRWPGRMEEVLPGVYLDGAHNPGAAIRLCESLQWIDKLAQAHPGGSPDSPVRHDRCLLFAVSGDKDYSQMIRILSHIPWKRIYVTRMQGDRAASISQVKTCFEEYCDARVRPIEGVREAFLTALREKKEDEYLLCTGSLYLVGEIQKVINILSESEDIS